MSVRLNDRNEIEVLVKTYNFIKDDIFEKCRKFKENFENDMNFIKEFVFCILTPQSKAENAWNSVEELFKENQIFNLEQKNIADKIRNVRFRVNKSKYIVYNLNKFFNNGFDLRGKIKSFDDVKKSREWLVENVKGYGYKEASHFLRNIGKGENIAILDRHILKSLLKLNIVKEIPKSLSRNKYYEIEDKIRKFSFAINIPFSHLDFVFWFQETSRIFK